MLGGGVVELSPEHAALGRPGGPLGIDRDRLHLGEVDHHAAVRHGPAGDVVTAAADRDLESRPAREGERRSDVTHGLATNDQSGSAVDEAVVHGAGRVVARVLRAKNGSGDLFGQLGDERGVQSCGPSNEVRHLLTSPLDERGRLGNLVAPEMVERGTRVRTVATPLSFPVASASGRPAEDASEPRTQATPILHPEESCDFPRMRGRLETNENGRCYRTAARAERGAGAD